MRISKKLPHAFFLQVSLLTSSTLAHPFKTVDQCPVLFEKPSADLIEPKKKGRPSQTGHRTDIALKLVQRSLESDPNDVKSHQLAADLCMKLSRFDEEVHHNLEVIRLQGPSSNNFEKLMSSYLHTHQIRDVLDTFERALSLSIANHRLVRLIMIAVPEIQDKIAVLESVDRWLEAWPQNELLLKLKVKLLLPLGRYDDAMEDVNTQLKLKPNSLHLLSLKAQILRADQRYGESLEVASQVLERDASNMLAYSMKTESLMGLARYDEAMSFIEAGIRESFHNEESRGADIYKFKMKFWILMLQGLYNEALQLVRTQTAWEPNRKLGFNLQIEALLALDRNEEAARLSLRALHDYHENPLTLSRVAQAMLTMGERGAAQAALNRALELSAAALRAIILKALVWAQENEPEKALAMLDQAKQRFPAQAAALRAYFLTRFGRLGEARQLLNSPALQKREELLTAVSSYFYMRAQNYEKALDQSRMLLIRDPESRPGQILRAQASLGLRDYKTVSRHQIRRHQGRDAILYSTLQVQVQEAMQNPTRAISLPEEVDDEILFSLLQLVDRVY